MNYGTFRHPPIVAFYHSKLAKATLDFKRYLYTQINWDARVISIKDERGIVKTTTTEQQAKSVIYMDDPKKVKENLLKAELAPQELLEGEHPRLLDEWQIAPQLWDAIRFDVDHRCGYGLIEIKIGGEILINEGAQTLLKLRDKIDPTKMKNPSFLMVLIGIGEIAYRREDGVYVVPIGCLKD